jgi:Asp/Glu/hydantoin racemase
MSLIGLLRLVNRLAESESRMTNAPFLGILMLDTAFERILGDVGNPASYPFPVRRHVVSGAGSLDVVTSAGPSASLTRTFIDAAQDLEAQGASALISSCGFLVHIQKELAKAVKIPVMVSALSLYPAFRIALGTRPIGLLTASAESLCNDTLAAAHIPETDVEIGGFDTCPAFRSAILAPKNAQVGTLDATAIRAHAVQTARDLIARRPDLGGFLLECGNLPPYADAIRQDTGLPVTGILDAADLLWRSTSPSASNIASHGTSLRRL